MVVGDPRVAARAARPRARGPAGADVQPPRTGLAEALAALCLGGVAATHGLDLGHKMEEAPYMAVLFMVLMSASVALALLLLAGRELHLAWSAALGLSLAAISGYVLSRFVALPLIEDHVGHWFDPTGVAALAFEASIVVLGIQSLRRLPSERALAPAMSVLIVGLVGVAATAASGGEHSHPDGHDPRFHRGNPSEYPSVSEASTRNTAKAQSLLSRTKQTAPRFDTPVEAARQGYFFSVRGNRIIGRPAIRHMRKDGGRYWGRLLDPSAPQSLVFWCPSRGACVLAAYMFRGPSDSSPPTYGGILSWHKHRPQETWMSHVWLTDRLREAFANCVPFNALQSSRGIRHVPYKVDVTEDQACSDTVSTVSEFD